MARLLAGRAEVRVLTTAVDRQLRREDVVDGVRVRRVYVDVRSRPSKLAATLGMFAALLRLAPWTDVIHVHGFSTKNVIVTVFAKLFRRPLILSLHTADHDEAPAIRQHSPMAWWAFQRAQLYLSVSPRLADAYLAAGLPQDRLRLVPNGIDMDRFRPATEDERGQLRRRLNLPCARPLVVFVGFFSADKQPRVAFDAWTALHARHGVDATLLFVGATRSAYFEVDEGLAAAMQQDANTAGRGDRLLFTGVTHDVQDYLRAADVFILPSRREGLPVALLEAMACGLPCVASRLAGSTDSIIAHGDNGLLVPVGEPGALAEAVAGVLRDPAGAGALGKRARETVAARFANTDVATLWLAAYRAVEGKR
jgi:glycosyltransferase involved in cell wall biosynthesis